MSLTSFFYLPNIIIMGTLLLLDAPISFTRAPKVTLSYEKLKRSMYRKRQRILPKNAQDVPSILEAFSDDNIFDKYGKTASGNKFFKTAYNCANFSYCIYASDDIIDLFHASIPIDQRIFLMDATFKIVPFGVFNQILIIYTAYMEKVFWFFLCFCFSYVLETKF